jgi:hypothetical protein
VEPGEWEAYMRDGKVVMVVRGYHTHEHAVEQARRVLELFGESGRAELVVDLVEIGSFARDARVHWQESLKLLRPCVHTISIVGGPPLVRMAGAAVCLYAGIKMRVFTTREEAFEPRPTTRSA